MALLGISRTDLREAALVALTLAQTDAAGRIYSPRPWAQAPAELPALMITTPSERKQSLGRSLPRFDSVISLAVVARVRGVGGNAALMLANAEAALEALADQIERGILCDPGMVQIVQQFVSVETHMTVSTESEQIIGEASIVFGCEVFQEYQPDTGEPLTEIDVSVPSPDGGQSVAFHTFPPQ